MNSVLLLNLGSPAAATVPAVKNYLREFLGDPAVISLPWILRKLLLEVFILPFYAKKSAARYRKIATKEGFPLITGTERIREGLENELKPFEISVVSAMRYGEPSILQAIRTLTATGTKNVFIIPLYPQRAESSWDSAVDKTLKVLKKHAPQIRPKVIEPYFAERGYTSALAKTAKDFFGEKKFDKLIFSFHGVPVKTKGAENYRKECETTAELTAEALHLPRERREIAFQSQFGRGKWLVPSLENRLKACCEEGFFRVAVMTPGFIVDCLETLEELGICGKNYFRALGGKSFELVPCLGNNPEFIKFLAEKVLSSR